MIMQTMPQKARPYGGCLNATLTTRGLRTQGQFWIPATIHHKETAVPYMEAFSMFSERQVMSILMQP